jgi:VanZ family protein
MSLIFYFSSLERIEVIETLPKFILKDKLLHIIEYSILAILFYRLLNQYEKLQPIALILAITLSTLYGLTDELHQLFVPGRLFSGLDLFADYIGSNIVLLRKQFSKIYFKN